jgi:hypothetical protein
VHKTSEKSELEMLRAFASSRAWDFDVFKTEWQKTHPTETKPEEPTLLLINQSDTLLTSQIQEPTVPEPSEAPSPKPRKVKKV